MVLVCVILGVSLLVKVVVGVNVGVGVGEAGIGLPTTLTFAHSEPSLGPGLVVLIKSLKVGISATILFIRYN